MSDYEKYRFEFFNKLFQMCEGYELIYKEQYVKKSDEVYIPIRYSFEEGRTAKYCARKKLNIVDVAIEKRGFVTNMLIVSSISQVAKNYIKVALEEQEPKQKNIWITKEDKVTEIGLYNLLYKNNESNVNLIFDNDIAFKKKKIVDLLAGAVCTDYEKDEKRSVILQKNGESFIFKGRVVIFTEFDTSYMIKYKKYHCLVGGVNMFHHDCAR